MKKIFRYSCLTLLTAFSLNMQAVPAYPKMMTVTQADGTTITVQLLGDEHSHLLVTEDGYPLCFNPQSKSYEYATLVNSRTLASGIIANAPAHRSAEEKSFLKNINPSSVQEYLNNERYSAMNKAPRSGANRVMKMNDVPTIGTHKALVVLVSFSDTNFSMTNPATYFDEFFHKNGFSRNGAQGCVTEWYKEGSNHLYDPVFDVYGPVQLSHPATYYAGGANTVMSGLQDTYKMILEVADLMDDKINFADYDTDGDGVCDNIYCVYAGYGQADTGNQNYIWPHSGNLTEIAYTEKGDYSFYADGVKIDRFTVSCEMNGISKKPAGIGTFVHEFGHVLGLADHYNNGDGGSNRPGNWDVMASGVYNNDQNTPPLFTAFERYSLGWLEPTELDLTTNTLVSVPFLEESNFAYRVSVPGKDNEYFLIENRQKKGWDKYVPGHGALVWHIEEDESLWAGNMPNGIASHQHVDVVEADKGYSTEGRASDPFPGTANITNFTFSSWAKDAIFGFAHVEEEGETVKFLLDGVDYTLETPVVSVSNITGTSAKINWSTPPYTRSFNIYIYKGEELLLNKTLTGNSYELNNLEAETEYKVKVIAVNSKLHSETAEIVFSTSHYLIDEQKAEALPATEVTDDAFTANWQPISIAENYEVHLLTRTLSGKTEVGTGFNYATQEDYDLPEGWTTDVTTTPNAQYGGESSPSFRFNTDNTYLEIRKPGLKLNSLRFWHRSNNGSNHVTVEQLVGGQWTQVGEAFSADAGVEKTVTLTLDNADAVRLIYHHKMGYFLVDDVYAGYTYYEYKKVKSVTTSEESYTFTGLDKDKLYSYAVRGQAGGKYTAMSDTIDVSKDEPVGIITVSFKGHDVQEDVMFNLAGQRIENAPRGIIIRNRKKILKY